VRTNIHTIKTPVSRLARSWVYITLLVATAIYGIIFYIPMTNIISGYYDQLSMKIMMIVAGVNGLIATALTFKRRVLGLYWSIIPVVFVAAYWLIAATTPHDFLSLLILILLPTILLFSQYGLSCIFWHKWNGCKCQSCGMVKDDGHDWDLCRGLCTICGTRRKIIHDWDGRICRLCGQTRSICEEAGHDWKGCTCCVCGEKRSDVKNSEHEWICGICVRCGRIHQGNDYPLDKLGHDWDGCTCKKCGKIRNENHNWEQCRCTICGEVRDESHNWEHCRCTICGKVRDEGHSIRDNCECEYCGRAFHEWSYSNHNRDVMTASWTQYCPICGKCETDWKYIQ